METIKSAFLGGHGSTISGCTGTGIYPGNWQWATTPATLGGPSSWSAPFQAWAPPNVHDALLEAIINKLRSHIRELEERFKLYSTKLTPTEYVDRQHAAFAEGVMWALQNIPEIADKLRKQEEAVT